VLRCCFSVYQTQNRWVPGGRERRHRAPRGRQDRTLNDAEILRLGARWRTSRRMTIKGSRLRRMTSEGEILRLGARWRTSRRMTVGDC